MIAILCKYAGTYRGGTMGTAAQFTSPAHFVDYMRDNCSNWTEIKDIVRLYAIYFAVRNWTERHDDPRSGLSVYYIALSAGLRGFKRDNSYNGYSHSLNTFVGENSIKNMAE